MRRLIILGCLVTLVLFGSGRPAHAADQVRLADLIAFPPARSGEVVVIEGEAIGQALRQSDTHVFVNVLDDATAVGVYMTREQAEVINGFGEYKRVGTLVRVNGVVNVACSKHGGDFDIHAVRVVDLRDSEPRDPEPIGLRLIFAPLALALGIGQLLMYRRMRVKRHLV